MCFIYFGNALTLMAFALLLNRKLIVTSFFVLNMCCLVSCCAKCAVTWGLSVSRANGKYTYKGGFGSDPMGALKQN